MKVKPKQFSDLKETIDGLENISKRLVALEEKRQSPSAVPAQHVVGPDVLKSTFVAHKASSVSLSKTVREALNHVFTKTELQICRVNGNQELGSLDEVKVRRLQLLASQHFNATTGPVNAIIAQKCVEERAGKLVFIICRYIIINQCDLK